MKIKPEPSNLSPRSLTAKVDPEAATDAQPRGANESGPADSFARVESSALGHLLRDKGLGPALGSLDKAFDIEESSPSTARGGVDRAFDIEESRAGVKPGDLNRAFDMEELQAGLATGDLDKAFDIEELRPAGIAATGIDRVFDIEELLPAAVARHLDRAFDIEETVTGPGENGQGSRGNPTGPGPGPNRVNPGFVGEPGAAAGWRPELGLAGETRLGGGDVEDVEPLPTAGGRRLDPDQP